jgi:hypothetical protein
MVLPSAPMDLRHQRIHDAQRAGLRNRIRDHWHVPEARADAMLEGWAKTASERGLVPGEPSYWQEGEKWLRAQTTK